MKIEPSVTVTISGKTAVRSLFKGIREGAEIQARVVERVGSRDAIIEIAGRRIRAQFLKGVPAGGTMTLKLDAVSGESYYFRLAQTDAREAFIRQIMEMTIFDAGMIRGSIMRALGAALAKHPAGLFELNALLLNRPHADKKDGLARFLDHLAQRGFDRASLADLSMLLSGVSVRSKHIQTLLFMLGFGEDRIRRLAAGKADGPRSMINGILKEIQSIDGKEERDAAIRQMLTFLTEGEGTEEPYRAGEFAFPGESGFHSVRYLESGSSWLFRLDLSGIGRIEILAREMEREFPVSVFCENEEALALLKNGSGVLMSRIEHIHPNIYINFVNTQQAINKIVEIYSYYSLNSEFDTRA